MPALQVFHANDYVERTLKRARTAKLVDVQIAAGAALAGVLTARRDFPIALKVKRCSH